MPKLRAPFYIKTEIYYLRRRIDTTRLLQKLERLEAQLKQSTKKQLGLLVQKLETQPDIYASGTRIYTFEHRWKLTEKGTLFHGETEYQPETLTDGHGRSILNSISW